ncbi:MAG: CPBP family intramembrane glutamic endopeptidase [Anaerolineaceae bacterium]
MIILLGMLVEKTTDPNAFSALTYLWVALLPFGFILIALFISLKVIHKRSPKSLISSEQKIRWRMLFHSGLIWFGLSVFFDFILSILQPGNYVFNFDLKQFLPYAILTLILVPIQVSAEEFIFRGYLTQLLGLISKKIWLPLMIPAMLFGLLHSLNLEVSTYGVLSTLPFYIGMGIFLGWVTIKSNGLELALGIHCANNLYAILITTFSGSSLPSPAIFQIVKYNPIVGLVVFVVQVFLYLALFPKKSRNSEMEI